jgi:hypothetical protein
MMKERTSQRTHPRLSVPTERSNIIRLISNMNDRDAASVAPNEPVESTTQRLLETVGRGPTEERHLLEALLTDEPLSRAKALQKILPVIKSLKDAAYDLRSDAVLAKWECGNASYVELATELAISKSLVQVMIREARGRRTHVG